MLTKDGLPVQRSPRAVSGQAVRPTGQPQGQRKSSAPAESRRHSSRPPAAVSEEEHSALISLLSSKETELASLRSLLERKDRALGTAEQQLADVQRDKASLVLQVHELRESESGRQKRERERQFEMQENLLAGFQRENEKATGEIEALKRR